MTNDNLPSVQDVLDAYKATEIKPIYGCFVDTSCGEVHCCPLTVLYINAKPECRDDLYSDADTRSGSKIEQWASGDSRSNPAPWLFMGGFDDGFSDPEDDENPARNRGMEIHRAIFGQEDNEYGKG